MYTKECPECGAEQNYKYKNHYEIALYKNLSCRSCSHIGHKASIEDRRKQSLAQMGRKFSLETRMKISKAVNKGGWITENGYHRIYINGISVYKHRHLMSIHLGRPLTSKEICHHKDGNKLNNDISNLEIMTRSEHMILHHPKGIKFGA